MKKISAVVILYNPEMNVLDNITTYVNSVDKLYIVDNSEQKNVFLLDEIKKYQNVNYIDNQGNQGIAHALNVGCFKAIEDGYEWILTMDQDSSFRETILHSYLDCSFNHPDLSNVALFSPTHSITQVETMGCDASYPYVVMTSGNILNLQVFIRIKGFEEKLFIDEVDHDYCLKAKLNGYLVIQFSNIFLNHELGEPKWIRRKGEAVSYRAHSPLRHYYITRNSLYCWKKYRRHYPDFIKDRQVYLLKTLVFALMHGSHKMARIKNILLGIYHFIVGHYGK